MRTVVLLTEHVCIQEKRLTEIEGDSKEKEKRIRQLEDNNLQIMIYHKQAREDIGEIKMELRDFMKKLLAPSNLPYVQETDADKWQPVTLALIKFATTALIVAGVVFGAGKILGAFVK
jgi:hypothetical protein